MSYVQNIIAAFGGVRAAARELGKPVSTVQSWKDRGSIPDSEKSAVLSASEAKRLGLTKSDFFPKTEGAQQ